MDCYLGGALFFVLFWIPAPLANVYTFVGIIVAGSLYVSIRWADRVENIPKWFTSQSQRVFRSPLLYVTFLAGLVVWIEAWTALSAPAGNTLDGANATLLTANLLFHGHFTALLLPYVNFPAYAPQGDIVWFAASHLLLGIPLWAAANETAPLFQGLTILAAAYLGRSWFKGFAGPVGMALAFALLLSWPRFLVQGTYDFVSVFPLFLFVLARIPEDFFRSRLVTGGGAIAPIGMLVGISMTYSPVPDEVILSGLLLTTVLRILSLKELRLVARQQLFRWGGLVLVTLVGALPSLLLLLFYPPMRVATGGVSVFLTIEDIGAILNPFAFGSGDLWISPMPLLHLEFALLLVSGIALFLLASDSSWFDRRELLQSSIAIVTGALGAVTMVLIANFARVGPVGYLVNLSEAALLFVTAEGLVVGIVVTILFQLALRKLAVLRDTTPFSIRPSAPAIALTLLLVAVVAVPLGATTQVAPSIMRMDLSLVSNVSPGDIAAMQYVASLPYGPVLVAPGSAGQFLAAFCPDPLIFPLVGIGGAVGFLAGNLGGPVSVPFGGPASNSTYQAVVEELTTGNVSTNLSHQLSILGVKYVLVTGQSSNLFAPFLASPMMSDPTEFHLVFAQQDAYVFDLAGQSSSL